MADKKKVPGCEYPILHEGQFGKCGRAAVTKVGLPLLARSEDGLLRSKKGKDAGAVAVAFCQYHGFLARSGQFGAHITDGQVHLSGPFKHVDMVECVVEAFIVDGRFDAAKKAVKKVDKELRPTPTDIGKKHGPQYLEHRGSPP